MPAPAAPSLVSLTTEGLRKAGYSSPSTAQLARAQNEWIEEIKNDIWLLGKRLKCLQTEHAEVLNGGQSRYDFPADFASILSARVLYGDEVDDVEGSADTTHVTLDSNDEDEGEDEIEGKFLLIYSGAGKGQFTQIRNYNQSTYEAEVYPAFTTQPATGDTYMLVDQFLPLKFKSVAHFDEIEIPHLPGIPEKLYAVGDDNHYGFYELFPVPDEDHYYGIHFRYYLNLLTLDLASARMATLYARWRNLWIQGVRARQLDSDDDGRAQVEMQRYINMVKDTVALETYGRNIKTQYTGIRG